MKLTDLPTPSLVLDEARMTGNIARLKTRLRNLGVALRPHLKTAKCVEIARRLMATPEGPATVSTLMEAEQFAAAGVRDILYAVGIAPNKLDRALALRAKGVNLSLVLDSVEQARAVAGKPVGAQGPIPCLIEIDSDGHRAGVRPGEARLVDIGRALTGGAKLAGVLTHAGASYNLTTPAALEQAAEQERAAAVASARALVGAGLPCPIVSVGSTPTSHFARDLTGVTEVRAGVFVFFDLVMLNIGVCTAEDLALSVLCSVIGHRPDKGWILVDAGWMAMSRDRGTARQSIDYGYGAVCDVTGKLLPDLIVSETSQEHGILSIRAGSPAALPDLPVGTLLRIFPNHACATAAQHGRYHVVSGDKPDVTATLERFSGW